MQCLLIIVFTLSPSIALAKNHQDLGATIVTATGMVLVYVVIAAIIRFFKK